MAAEKTIPSKELERWYQAPEIDPGTRFVRFQFCNDLQITLDFPSFLEDVEERLNRWKLGQYRVKEAAQVLSEAYPGMINASSFCKQLEKAIRRGKLVLRENGIPIEQEDLPDGSLGTRIVEARDLNDWLCREGSPYLLSYPYGEPERDGQADRASIPRATRLQPTAGDNLTPIVWRVCYEIHEAGDKVTPRPVMARLQALAESDDLAQKGCLVAAVAGGVKWEPLGSEDGKDRELTAEMLAARIREWKIATGLGAKP